MQKYAQFEPGEVNGVRTVYQVIESDTDPDGTNGEWVACADNVGPRCTSTDGGLTFSPPAVPAPVADPCEWLIDLGPFADRLQPATMSIDLSTDPKVMGINKDLARRKFIDLKDPRVTLALGFLAGEVHPQLGTIAAPLITLAMKDAALNTPVEAHENLALRKDYFS